MKNLPLPGKKQYLFTTSEAARFLGISTDTLKNWEKSGKLVARRTKTGLRQYRLDQLSQILQKENPALYELTRGTKETSETNADAQNLSISEAARFLGVSPDTLRNWEKLGRITPERNKSGSRVYTKASLREALENRHAHIQVEASETPITTDPEVQTPSIDSRNPYQNVSKDKLISLESLFTNHISAHNKLAQALLYPTLVGISLLGTITLSYFSLPKETVEYFSPSKTSNIQVLGAQTSIKPLESLYGFGRWLLSPFNALATGTVIVMAPEKAQEIGLVNQDLSSSIDTDALKQEILEEAETLIATSLSELNQQETISVSYSKLPALTSLYVSNLDGSELTGVNAHHLNGVAASDFLRSDETDTAEGVITFTASPGSVNVNGGSLYINPSASSPDYTLFGIAVGGNSKLRVDTEGDTYLSGDLGVSGGDLTTDSSIFNLINTNAGTINLGGAATSVNIGASTGTTQVNNNLGVSGNSSVSAIAL